MEVEKGFICLTLLEGKHVFLENLEEWMKLKSNWISKQDKKLNWSNSFMNGYSFICNNVFYFLLFQNCLVYVFNFSVCYRCSFFKFYRCLTYQPKVYNSRRNILLWKRQRMNGMKIWRIIYEYFESKLSFEW